MLGPLVFFTRNQSNLPHYVLPLMPAFALGAARVLTREASELGGGVGVARRAYVGTATVLGLALASLTLWLPAPISLTPAERAAIPPTALALGIALLTSAALVWYAGRTAQPRPALAVMGYALIVTATPILSGRLLTAVGEDRSAAALARVIQNTQATDVIGISAFPPSLPFYLRHPVLVATATGWELTSAFVAYCQERFRR